MADRRDDSTGDEAPADGTYGNSERAPLRLPGVNQWDLTLSKNWYPREAFRIQFRAEMINAFNHTQFTTLNTSCPNTATSLSCVSAGSRFGQLTGIDLWNVAASPS